MKYLRYLWYVIKHKWFVFAECKKVGIWWLGVVHDLSKFLPSEFFPYANYFYGNYKSRSVASAYEKAYYNFKYKEDIDKEFDFAWLLHQKRNKHHWQWWILPEDNGGVKVLEMCWRYQKEMVCDWQGASRAQHSKSTVYEWYRANGSKMQLHPATKSFLEDWLWFAIEY